MKKRFFNVLFVGLLVCTTYVAAFATGGGGSGSGCQGTGHWEQDDDHIGEYECVLGGTECN